MGLWISILLLLIVVVLWQVYTQIEAFTASASGTDASGAVVRRTTARTFSPEEILAALSGPQYEESTGSANAAAAPAQGASTSAPAAAPANSAAMTKQIEERLAKRISTQIKSELLSQRATEPIDSKYAPCEVSPSDAEAQGAEYAEAKPGFNINNYIRKDSIPCWACSLPPA